jgi:hypothetical protein
MTDQSTAPSSSADDTAHVLPTVHGPTVNSVQPSAYPGQTMSIDSALVPIPDTAEDNDLIEKEWVLKAKQIVEQTAEDPFLQQQELSKIKAEYLKKRYNKVLDSA